VTYEELDVAQDAKARDEMVKLSGRLAVPVIVIDDDVIVGFDQKTIEERLHKTG
jgi:glutaredoxin 3